jgi:mono/diheme cytochrome c family protein
MRGVKIILVAVVAGFLMLTVIAGSFVYFGLYDVAADKPHRALTTRLFVTSRERAVERRSRDIQPPALDDPRMVRAGATMYAEMCAMCHLAPGMRDNDLRRGMNPRPPQLAESRTDPRVAFWTIKHGIRMSGMPTWSPSHDDAQIWSMVAFIDKLPGMTADQYQSMTSENVGHHNSSPASSSPTPSGDSRHK